MESLPAVDLTLSVDEASTGYIIEEVVVFFLSFLGGLCVTLLLALGSGYCEACCISVLT